MKSIKRLIKNFIVITAERYGYEVTVQKKQSPPNKPNRPGLNLNVAAGRYEIDGFVSLDFYSDHYYSDREHFEDRRVNYDLRNDALPYTDDSVDNIYISHAIEHIETAYVERFIQEAYRVLKVGGVLRVACPDAEFLYEVSTFNNAYWTWREPSIRDQSKYDCQLEQMTQGDYLIRELATPRMRFYKNRIPSQVLGPEIIVSDYDQVMVQFRSGLHFRPEHPGEHINNWDFSRLQEIGNDAGFRHIIRSKPGGSVSKNMQGPDFDLTAPEMSLYIEFVK